MECPYHVDFHILRMESCVFCQIVQGIAEASVVYTDEACIAFLDTEPVNPGHVLVVPKVHVTYLSELDEEIGAHLLRVAMRISRALRGAGVRCEAVNFLLSD